MNVVRRLGDSPRVRGCLNETNCPDVFELSTGDFAVIGEAMTDRLRGLLPDDAGVGPDEHVVVIPRDVLVRARRDIPEK
ncbi:hypothetical protein M2266_000657 [Streptomyces sp. SPB162]|nr:hypothetical protein [Streptomyces sp. SPB162]MDF9811426.1 hypothetical protein [Streptomyces sp. SPB162]